LYSSKANWSKALRHRYTIAQARSDVLFSLLFGGQVCCSAGAFFDSPIALRVFGELSSHPKFDSFCREYGWRPLRLNTDGRSSTPGRATQPDTIDFITSRWRNKEMSFTFFRESELSLGDPDQMPGMKESASSALESRRYGSLADVLEPLYGGHKIEHALDAELKPKEYGSTADLREPLNEGRKVEKTSDTHPRHAVVPAILTDDTGKWFESLIGYLSTYRMLEDREAAEKPDILDGFFPLAAVCKRTENIAGSSKDHSRDYSKNGLEKLNKAFVRDFGNPPTMNVIHKEGPTHYGHYYPLIAYWIETEWHQVRQRMYGAKSCILSSDWQMRDMFDFDSRSMASYISDVRIDDSLRVTEEGFGEVSWDVLLETISDRKWRDLMKQMRDERDSEGKRKLADKILNLLASKLSEFHFDHQDGIVSISMKKISADLGYLASYTHLVMKHHNTLEGLLGAQLAKSIEVAAGIVAKKPLTETLQTMLAKGFRYVYEFHKGRQLRRAIIPDIYIGSSIS
jgi:hypothetical protein